MIVELDVFNHTNIDVKWAPLLRQLPKGGRLCGESLEETALREVLEETGYETSIILKAGVAQWSYERDGAYWDETVHYYYMKPLQQTAQRDQEFDTVRWISLARAVEELSYPEERFLVMGLLSETDLINLVC